MRRVPLPTVLLRWNLRLAYRNQAAAESCAVWQRGPSEARFIKLKAPIPPEILNQCRVLKKRWEHLSPLSLAPANFWDETVRHPTRCDLRATISLKQISSAAFARPHFLVEFESFHGRAANRISNQQRFVVASGSPHESRTEFGAFSMRWAQQSGDCR